MKLDGHSKMTNSASAVFSARCSKAVEILNKEVMCHLPQFSKMDVKWDDWMDSNETDNMKIARIIALQEISIIGESLHSIKNGYLTRETAAVDIEPLKLPLHFMAVGQKYHFMRDKSDKNVHTAYNHAVNFIKEHANEWVDRMHHALYTYKKRPSGNPKFHHYQPSRTSIRRDGISHLALSLHSLQDSFSPAHTKRKNYEQPFEPGAIEDMYIYATQDHEKHSRQDYESGSFYSLYSQSAIFASVALMRLCVATVSQKSKSINSSSWAAFQEKWIRLAPSAA